jgi:NAD-dependent dihydropyrimidine dehydrogenase PreA subunit
MPEIKVTNEENCSGCLRCALACSFFNTSEREFNLSESKIKIERLGGQNKFKVSFKEDCTNCGICVDYCNYEVLSME